MANQKQNNRPETPPDPARSYERARPEAETGMGRLDAPQAIPEDSPDKIDEAVTNEHPSRQVNADDVVDDRETSEPAASNKPAPSPAPITGRPAPKQPDHSMHNEEPLGEDQTPTNIQDPQAKRHPRTEGKGGVK